MALYLWLQSYPSCREIILRTNMLLLNLTTIASLLSIYLILVSAHQRFERLSLPTNVVGPESLAFTFSGVGPYTGVSDGRILKWEGHHQEWVDFAVTSAKREKRCDGSQSSSLESLCGRPLGLQFSWATGQLYIADAYYGLVVVGPMGGVAAQLATEADGDPFRFLNGLDIDQDSGVVYFTDSSTRFQRKDYMLILTTGDATGRLMKYDPWHKEVTVLLRGLSFPNGVTLSKEKSFLLITETTTCRILRYWLQGPKASTSDEFVELPGNPDNVKTNNRGEFWVALNQITNERCRRRLWSLDVVSIGDNPSHSNALRLSEEGYVLEVFDPKFLVSPSEVSEQNGRLWIGSVVEPYVGVYKP